MGDRAGEGRTYGNLGCAYKSLGQLDKAIEFHQKGLKIALEVGNRDGEELAYGKLFHAYNCAGQSKKAAEFQHKFIIHGLGLPQE